ncbi:GNAT family N-acetyltransferase [Undibacterium sp. Jales W-56]|uniref:GNAT family N-acetyltransferase n=1 Tax=Undibacterium sp. Jales W-56 TaxID=2897325 RepID=UPI0021CE5D6A|nr:GNAT family N-acetyltransferase [Undibacterium sp. Jales W-56]MCU6433671.1 GNAT family N-acetyltransferase [Undibacterium sp. Jales W-56]
MTSLNFKLADLSLHRDTILTINNEYMSWVASGIETSFGISVANLLGMSIPAYVASVIDKVCSDQPPRGAFYLVELNGELAGMVGLRWLRDGVAEIKRLYVRPPFRGKQLGEALLRKVLNDARAFGYQRVCLDTAPFMLSAQRLYKSFGFNECAPYVEAEVPVALHATWHFMALDLNQVENTPL